MEELVNETLSEKMKRYENETSYKLKVKEPVIIRIDGKAFHTFTKGLNKPFDEDLSFIMQYIAKSLAENIQNVKFVYSQSDEISLLLTDWDKINTAEWFGYRIQKMTSVSASIATASFNKYMMKVVDKYTDIMTKNIYKEGPDGISSKVWALWYNKQFQAIFDSRVFNIPKEEVSNYFLYRYKDAKRNSISALAQCYFSQKQLECKSTEEMIQMVKEKSGIDYESLSSLQKVGFAVYKENEDWVIDIEVPDIYENRYYVEKWL